VIFLRLLDEALRCAKENDLKLLSFSMGDLLTHTKILYKDQVFIGVTITPRNEGDLFASEYESLEQLLNGGKTYDISKRAFALSAINAIGQFLLSLNKPVFGENLRTELSSKIVTLSKKDDKIVFIGNLSPVVTRLKQLGKNVTVFCRESNNKHIGIYNDIFEYEAVSQADIVVITGASLIGSTIDAILKFTTNTKAVILAGFSAGGYPKWYEGVGITHIGSIYLEDFVLDKKDTTLDKIFDQKCYFVEIGNS